MGGYSAKVENGVNIEHAARTKRICEARFDLQKDWNAPSARAERVGHSVCVGICGDAQSESSVNIKRAACTKRICKADLACKKIGTRRLHKADLDGREYSCQNFPR